MGRRRRKRRREAPQQSSSWLGRYLAQKAIRQQSRQDHAGLGLASAPAVALSSHPVTLPAGYVANELVSNEVVQGKDPRQAKKILSEAQRGVEKRTWGEQFTRGLKQSPGWALGGAFGGGLAGYFLSQLQGRRNPSEGALVGASIGAGAGGAAPIVYSMANKYILDKMSTKKDKEKAKELLAEKATRTSLMPLGDVAGAIEKRGHTKSAFMKFLSGIGRAGRGSPIARNPLTVHANAADRLRQIRGVGDRFGYLRNQDWRMMTNASKGEIPGLPTLRALVGGTPKKHGFFKTLGMDIKSLNPRYGASMLHPTQHGGKFIFGLGKGKLGLYNPMRLLNPARYPGAPNLLQNTLKPLHYAGSGYWNSPFGRLTAKGGVGALGYMGYDTVRNLPETISRQIQEETAGMNEATRKKIEILIREKGPAALGQMTLPYVNPATALESWGIKDRSDLKQAEMDQNKLAWHIAMANIRGHDMSPSTASRLVRTSGGLPRIAISEAGTGLLNWGLSGTDDPNNPMFGQATTEKIHDYLGTLEQDVRDSSKRLHGETPLAQLFKGIATTTAGQYEEPARQLKRGYQAGKAGKEIVDKSRDLKERFAPSATEIVDRHEEDFKHRDSSI